MGPLRRLAVFFYDFVVGEDPRIAVAVAVALGLTAVVAGAGVSAWWVMPLAVVAVLGFSIHRATEPARRPARPK
jgi:hypothetical protein